VSLLQKRDPYRPFGRQDPLTMAGSVSQEGVTAQVLLAEVVAL
jgi:hypothetical protein